MLLLYVAETASAKQGWTTIPWTLTRRLSEAFTRYDTIYGTPLNLPATAELRNSYLPSQLECLSKQSRLTSYIVEMYTYHMRGHQLFRSATISSYKFTPLISSSPNCKTRISIARSIGLASPTVLDPEHSEPPHAVKTMRSPTDRVFDLYHLTFSDST